MNRNRFDPASDRVPLVGVVAAAVTVLTLTTAFGAMALGVEVFWVAFPVGFGGVMPLATALAAAHGAGDGGSRDDGGEDPTGEDALSTLREQYARGRMDEREFEERVETLLATEDHQ